MTLHDDERIQERLKAVADPVGFLINLFAHAPVGFAVWNADGRTLLTNKAFFDIFRSEPPPEYNVLKDDVLAANGMLPLFQRAFAGETVRVPTFWFDPRELTAIEVRDGRRVAVSMTIFPLFKASGEIDYVAATYKDETEIMLANERLRLSDVTLQSIGDAVIATDAAGTVTRMNPVAEQLTGWNLSDAMGRKLAEVFDIRNEDTGELVESPVDHVLREGNVVGLANHTILVSRDGVERAIADSGAPIRDDAGDLRGVVLVFHDQTVERKAQRAVSDAAARLQVLAETSRHFAAATHLNDLFDVVARRVSAVLGELCAIHLVRHDSDELETVAIHHPEPETLAMTRELLFRTPLRRGHGLSGKVAVTKQPALLTNITTDQLMTLAPTPEYRPVVERLAVSSFLAVPLEAGGKVIGILNLVRSHRMAPYTADDLQLAQDLADRAALAIEKARLLEKLEKQFAELQRSEARFRRLADARIIGIITADFAGNILEANDAFLAMVGYTSEEVLSGRVRWSEMTPPEWRHLDERAIEQLKATGIATPWEKEYVRKDGTRIPILVGVAMVEETPGQCICFVLDLTERKRAQAALRESEARKAAVMEAALDAIVLMDHEGKITEFNSAAERTFGYAREEVVGKPLADVLIPPHLRDQHREGLERYLATGTGNILGRRIEVPALRKSEVSFPAEVAVVRIRSEGAPVFTGYIRDISDRRRAAEAELLRREKEASQIANRELEAFSYSVAHDLRAPLRSIRGFSGALLEDYGAKLDEGGKALLHRVAANAERMAHLIDALLSLARVSRAELRREPVDMTQIARAVMEQLATTEPARSAELVAMEGVTANGDPQLLRAVLENLLGNAWKFTANEPRARIEFGCTRLPDATRYYVRDNGAGFDMQYADRLFAPFQRLHSTKQFEGTGIGLATVQRIIHRHGGRVWAEAKPEAGATFQFTLPE